MGIGSMVCQEMEMNEHCIWTGSSQNLCLQCIAFKCKYWVVDHVMNGPVNGVEWDIHVINISVDISLEWWFWMDGL